MEWAEGGVWGWGGKNWGAKCSPREPGSPANPNRHPVLRFPTKERSIGASTGPKARDRQQAARTDQKPGPKLPASPPRNRPNPLNPDSQPRHPVPRPKKPLTPNEEEPARNTRSEDQECGPTPKKRAAQPAQCNKNTPDKGGHMTNMPSHPQTHGAEPTECPVPVATPAGYWTAATTRPAGQQNTSHNNTEAGN
ncbi:hypothetical protein CRENBAI_007643 [Crenichthys baileyi]|uniref:Uncharacterized protein n=1 Tax=Crenichthys baileyi TaxID=28760 RepID=A0AAV9R9S9_9TELE